MTIDQKAAKVINACRKEINNLHSEDQSALANDLKKWCLGASNVELARFYDIVTA